MFQSIVIKDTLQTGTRALEIGCPLLYNTFIDNKPMTYQFTHKELDALCSVFLEQVDWYDNEFGLESEECKTLYHKLTEIRDETP